MHNAKLYNFLKCIISKIFFSVNIPRLRENSTNNNNELASILSCCCGNAFFFWATCKIEKFSRVARNRKKKKQPQSPWEGWGVGCLVGGREFWCGGDRLSYNWKGQHVESRLLGSLPLSAPLLRPLSLLLRLGG